MYVKAKMRDGTEYAFVDVDRTKIMSGTLTFLGPDMAIDVSVSDVEEIHVYRNAHAALAEQLREAMAI